MTRQYDDTNRGVLFKNHKKETEKHPDYTGRINVNGTDWRLAAWLKEGKNGKFLSLSVSEQTEKREPASSNTPIDLDDEVPF